MGAIAYRTFGSEMVPYLTLANEEYVRPMGIRNDWTSLRVMVACAITPAAGLGDITGGHLFIGVCSGANGYASSDCAYALGAGTGIDRTFTYVGGATPNYSFTLTGTANRSGVRAGVLNGFTSNMRVVGPQRGIFEVRISDVGSGFVLNPQCAYTPADADWNLQGIQELAEDDQRTPIATVNGVTTTFASINQASYTKYSDPLDSVNIYWNQVNTPLEIYAIAVARTIYI